ncbi:MAG: ABC transporter ATP-binding protein, partial [Anaerolineae bacterium]
MSESQLLRVRDLKLHFRTSMGPVQAVDGVDLDLDYTQAMVILGESGCGKTSLAKAILRLLPRNVETYSGEVYLDGTELMRMDDEEFRRNVRWVQMSLVPQAAMNALNPVLKVGDQVAEPMLVHAGVKKATALLQAKDMFQRVGVPTGFMDRYAFELSGGMRQRVAIAMSLVTAPSLIVLDEPTSALDVLTQANIFNVLKRIKQELEVSFILITHDIATSSELADRVAVMYAGQIVEVSDASRFFEEPLHP